MRLSILKKCFLRTQRFKVKRTFGLFFGGTLDGMRIDHRRFDIAVSQ